MIKVINATTIPATATKPSRTNEQSEHAKLKILRDNLWAPTINTIQKAVHKIL